jgi:LuxR family transcriptional regulator, maltose regulon positive regulatory protein
MCPSAESFTLLTTKARVPPPRERLVNRPRLFARLDEAVSRPLTVISAPAGFGKSTLVSDWVRNHGETSVAWVSLDHDDNDLSRFVSYMVAALQPLQLRIGKAALSLLGSLQAPTPEDLMTQLLNEVADLRSRIVLVLEDYHLITDPQIDAALTYAVDHMPRNFRLIVTTRKDPSFAFPAWRALQRVTEIGAEDLRFTPEESAAFLETTMDVALDAKSVSTLAARTEGWVAGLQMAALSLQGHIRTEGEDCIKEYVKGFGGEHRFIADYLHDIYYQQPGEIRDFLAQTAILDQLCPPLCDAVTGWSDSQSILAYLEQNNLFVVRLDDHRFWYRYHQLFLDYLRAALPPVKKRVLHSRAKTWHETFGFGRQAIRHALAAEETSEALRLLRANVDDLASRGEFATILSWLESMSKEIVLDNSDLSGFKAWILYLHGRIGEAEAYATLALESQTANSPVALRGALLAFQAFLAINRGNPKQAVPIAKEALASFGDSPSFFRVCALSLLGHAQRQSGDQSTASATLRETVDLGRRHGNEAITLDALGGLTTLMCAQGQLREAMHLCDDAVRSYVDGRGRPLPVAGLVYVPRGVLNYESNDLEQARHDLNTGITLCRRVGMIYFTLLGQRTLARVYHASGDYQAAWNTLAAASQLAVQSENPRRKRLVDAVAAELNLREGNIAAAERALEGLRTGHETPSEYERLVGARLLIAKREFVKAESILAQLERSMLQAKRFGRLIAVHVLQALCKHGQGHDEKALGPLKRAVCLAAPENYRQVFLDEGPVMGALLGQLTSVAPNFATQLLRSLSGAAPPEPVRQVSEQPLTQTQVKIVSLLARGLTNHEIARELSITLGTAKWHVHQIFTKLDVRNRTEAVASARRIGLVA